MEDEVCILQYYVVFAGPVIYVATPVYKTMLIVFNIFAV